MSWEIWPSVQQMKMWQHQILYMGRVKQKSAFKHMQNAQIQIILHMHKVSLDICSPFIYSVVSNDSASIQGKPWSDCADALAIFSISPKTHFRMAKPI